MDWMFYRKSKLSSLLVFRNQQLYHHHILTASLLFGSLYSSKPTFLPPFFFPLFSFTFFLESITITSFRIKHPMPLTSLHESQKFELRSKGIALVSGLSTAQVSNDTIFFFGGGQSNLWSLNTSLISEDYSEQEIEASPPLHWMYASPGLPWTSELENHTSGFLVVGTAQPTDPFLTIQFFNPLSRSWSLFSSNSTTASTTPTASRHHSSFLLNQQQQILVYGGENSTHAMGYFWSYGIQTQSWTPLELPRAMNVMRCGHSASLLDDGRLLILGGWVCSKDQLLNDSSGAPRPLADLSKALVYDTFSGRWFEQPTQGPYPQSRAYHTAVKSKA